MNLDRFRQKPLMGILRGVTSAQLGPTLDSAIAAGLETLEITMNTAEAAELIAQAKSAAGSELEIGAGTVLTLRDLDRALSAGAAFIVMPTLVEDVVAECVRRGVPVFPGALTPQESAVDGGPLINSKYIEQLTVLLIHINKIYKAHSGVRITGF